MIPFFNIFLYIYLFIYFFYLFIYLFSFSLFEARTPTSKPGRRRAWRSPTSTRSGRCCGAAAPCRAELGGRDPWHPRGKPPAKEPQGKEHREGAHVGWWDWDGLGLMDLNWIWMSRICSFFGSLESFLIFKIALHFWNGFSSTNSLVKFFEFDQVGALSKLEPSPSWRLPSPSWLSKLTLQGSRRQRCAFSSSDGWTLRPSGGMRPVHASARSTAAVDQTSEIFPLNI